VIIGEIKSRETRDDGEWFKVLLDKSNVYAKRVWDAAIKGLARASGGSAVHLIRYNDDGEITNFPLIELSLFDATEGRTPASNYAVALPALKARGLEKLLADITPTPRRIDSKATKENRNDETPAVAVNINQPKLQGVKSMNNLGVFEVEGKYLLYQCDESGEAMGEPIGDPFATVDEAKAALASMQTPPDATPAPASPAPVAPKAVPPVQTPAPQVAPTVAPKAVKTVDPLEVEINNLKKQMEKIMTTPAIKSGGYAVPKSNAPLFNSLGEQLMAIKAAATNRGEVDRRLLELNSNWDKAMKATGLNEGVGSEGAFLLQPDFASELLMPLRTAESSPFVSRARKLPIGTNANSGFINGVDETDRATGSRWGGVRGYRLNESGTKTGSKPAFKQLQWRLKKYAVLCYATDELIADATQLQAVLSQAMSEEVSFMANDDVLNGLGAAGPLGIVASSGRVTVSKETGQAAATIVNANLIKMWARMHVRSRANAVWFINQDTEPQLDQLYIPAGVSSLEPRYVTYSSDGVMKIKGRPVIATEFNPTLGTEGDIVLADMSEYLYWDRAPENQSSIHVAFLTDETVFRAVYRVDGFPSLTTPITPYKGSNTLSPFVTLATRS